MSIKQITVVFDYNPETDEVTNVKTTDVATKKKTKTTPKKEVKADKDDEVTPLVTREEKKLIFNKAARELLEIEADDRVAVKYLPVEGKKGKMFPVIEKCDEETEGSKRVTKTGSIAYSGKQNTVLEAFGTSFMLIAHEGDIYKLVSTSETSGEDNGPSILEEVIEQASQVEPVLITDDLESSEITSVLFEL